MVGGLWCTNKLSFIQGPCLQQIVLIFMASVSSVKDHLRLFPCVLYENINMKMKTCSATIFLHCPVMSFLIYVACFAYVFGVLLLVNLDLSSFQGNSILKTNHWSLVDCCNNLSCFQWFFFFFFLIILSFLFMFYPLSSTHLWLVVKIFSLWVSPSTSNFKQFHASFGFKKVLSSAVMLLISSP